MDVLYSWVGHADLKSFLLQSADEDIKSRVISIISGGNGLMKGDALGPIESVVRNREFGKVVLLWSYSDQMVAKAYEDFIGCNCMVKCLSIKNPIDYEEIYKAVDKTLGEQEDHSDDHRHILLSSGTPAMAAVWLLLGKTKYPATFLQVFKGKVIETGIPFDLRLDVISGIIRENDQKIGGIPDSLLKDASGFNEIVGSSSVMRQAVNMGRHAALHDVNVLLTGESGTGKEMFARAIHLASHRSSRPFVAVNCAALTESLLDSELFGYVKGAFTGAAKDSEGLFRKTDGGTLFLDEIGECSPGMQRKLLRVLQPPVGRPFTFREFTPVGGSKADHADVRIIAATNRNLIHDINSGAFRGDLFYRLSSVSICLPPLRERAGDISILAEHLLSRINEELGANPLYTPKRFTAEALRTIETRRWEGNVRELLNAIIQGAVMATSDVIRTEDMGLPVEEPIIDETAEADDLNLDKAIDNLKRKYIQMAIEKAGNSKSKAYKLLGMKSYQRLDSMIRSLGMEDYFMH